MLQLFFLRVYRDIEMNSNIRKKAHNVHNILCQILGPLVYKVDQQNLSQTRSSLGNIHITDEEPLCRNTVIKPFTYLLTYSVLSIAVCAVLLELFSFIYFYVNYSPCYLWIISFYVRLV